MDLRTSREDSVHEPRRARRRPVVVLVVLFGGVLAAYLATCLLVLRDDPLREATFHAGSAGGEAAVQIYA
ncbi:MAG: hypothetical protein J0H35_05510, partial [Rhodospirillales bacterium]|nr:hypothetical protein [Rhodospirillales bacterium]